MEQSASISPELSELFSKIRAQAKEYDDAFISIRNQKLHLELLKNTLEDFARTKTEQIEILITEFTNSVAIALEKIEAKNNEIISIYPELYDAKKLKQNLNDLYSVLNKTKKDFDNIISSAPDIVKESAETELDRLSRKVLTNIRQFDGKLLNIDEKSLQYSLSKEETINISQTIYNR